MPRSAQSSSKSTPARFSNPLSSVGHPVPYQPSFGQTLKEGFALGTGSAIAHRVVSSVFGAPTVNVQSSSQNLPQPCEKERLAFETCMKTKSADDFCGEQQMGYTQCLRIARGEH